ncbi:Hypothetical protein NocV09_00702730 [Nannochloropsis oceanica]
MTTFERSTSWNSTKDDAFGLEFEFGDLLVDTDHSHSLMEVTAMLEQVDGMPCGSFTVEQETPVATHHHSQQSSLNATGFAPKQQQMQQQTPQAPQRRPSSSVGHLQALRNASSSKKNAYPLTPVPSPCARFQHQNHHQQPMQDENASPVEHGSGSSMPCSNISSSHHAGGSTTSNSGAKKVFAPRINVRLMPQNSATAARVRQAGYNPKLELSTPLGKRVGFFIDHLASKWSDVPGIASLSLRLAVSPTQQLEEHVALRSLSAYFAAAKMVDAATGAGGATPSAVLQLHYVLRQDMMNEWHPEENSLFDAFAASGLDQLPSSAPTAPSIYVTRTAVDTLVYRPQQQEQDQQKKRRKRVSLTTGDAFNRNETFVNAATLVISTPAPIKPSPFSSSSSSFESSGDSSVTQAGHPGSGKKRRRIRPTLLPPGEVVATSPSFLQAQCGIGSLTSESSRQSSFSNSGDDSQQ